MLRNKQQVSKRSALRTLNPFISLDGLIRVGGRLAQTTLSPSSKCPIVIPSNHKVTQLLFQYEHESFLHIGPQALLAQVHRSC